MSGVDSELGVDESLAGVSATAKAQPATKAVSSAVDPGTDISGDPTLAGLEDQTDDTAVDGSDDGSSDGLVNGGAKTQSSSQLSLPPSGTVGAPQQVDALKAVHGQSQQQALAADGALQADQLKEANLAGAAQQAAEHQQFALPNGATVIATSNESAAADSSKLTVQNRESIAQRIQPGLPSLSDTSSQVNEAQATLAASGNGSSGGNDSGGASGGASGQEDSRSSARSSAQSSSQAHSTADGKSSGASDSSASAAQPSATSSTSAQPNISAATSANAATITTAAASQSAHLTAQAAAQGDASASAASAMKSTADGSSSAGQSTSLPPSLPSGLPRSLNDISQATQLYQRVGGAEMHIAMDTDLLGPIDLRAIVHQGSLSATIGVERADVQTLLVNELPALQHSLSEKNMQVGQISVLAGSIGSGTNPNNQPHDQPSRQNTCAPVAPVYRDDSSPAYNTRVPLGATATWTGNSARLSVLA
jgi:hypothetical protein